MKYILAAAMLVLLTGCVTVPVAQKFPEVPSILLENCEDLIKLENDAKLSEVARTVVSNYTKYNECALKNESWIEWYKKQKQLFEELK